MVRQKLQQLSAGLILVMAHPVVADNGISAQMIKRELKYKIRS